MGNWKNIQEMEDVLTLDELYALVSAEKRREESHREFMAALQGIDLNEGKGEEEFERIKLKAEADMAGKTEEQFTFDMIGIQIESDDDD